MDELLHFHFLRPWVLLLIPCLIGFTFWLRKQRSHHTGFEQWIDLNLLQYLTANTNNTIDNKRQLIYYLLAAAWVIVTLALAGPTWKQLPQALHQSEQPMIVILDLSPSMLAQDNKPSRIVRARLKIQDLLTQRKDGLTALVVYGGEAHVVTPLTDDSQTIINLLSTLEPGLLPIPGSNIEMAVDLALQLTTDAGLANTALVIVTDGIAEAAINSIQRSIIGRSNQNSTDVFIVGLGTKEGSPIPASASNRSNNAPEFLRDQNNQIIRASRNDQTLNTLAKEVGGYYLPLQANDSDIQFIIQQLDDRMRLNKKTAATDRNSDEWEEFGPTLLLLFLPFFALMFRKGWLLCLSIVIPLSFAVVLPQTAEANTWEKLWLNNDQLGTKAFEKKDYSNAQQHFTHKQWQGSAAYKNKDYEQALEAFSQGDSASDYYNKGNALSQLGRYDEAIEAYDTALQKQPNFDDAKTNKRIIEEIKKQKEQQEQSKDNSENQNSQANDQKSNDQKNDGQESSSDEKDSPQDSKKENQSPNSSSNNEENNKSEADEENTQEQDQEREKEDKKTQEQRNNSAKENNKEANDDQQSITDKDKISQDKLSQEEQDALAHLSKEEKQELEQWLRKVPDDPSGLLRRKFQYEFQKRRQLYQNGQWSLPENNAHQRY